MPSREKMKCPHCGAEMNHHADKILRAESAATPLDSIFGGVVLELHSCPGCGASGARSALDL
ncbi:MAG TPA: hypothetical protein VFA68_11705 [Terriglobales bacterium]|nr:hypothetical protein [Terriglobales bacterium]